MSSSSIGAARRKQHHVGQKDIGESRNMFSFVPGPAPSLSPGSIPHMHQKTMQGQGRIYQEPREQPACAWSDDLHRVGGEAKFRIIKKLTVARARSVGPRSVTSCFTLSVG